MTFHACLDYATPDQTDSPNNMRCALCSATWVEREYACQHCGRFTFYDICSPCADESGIKPDYAYTER